MQKIGEKTHYFDKNKNNHFSIVAGSVDDPCSIFLSDLKVKFKIFIFYFF